MEYIDFTPINEVARLRDPEGSGHDRIWFNVRIDTLPSNIPLDPNPRDQNTATKVAKDIAASARDPKEKYFHIMNRGFLMVGHSIERLSNGNIRVHLRKNVVDVEYGLGDGGTTYAVLVELLTKEAEIARVVGNKFITVEVLSRLAEDDVKSMPFVVNKIVGARNTSVQVKETSLSDHRGDFDFIKQGLADTEYGEKIIFRENAEGVVDVRDVVFILTLLNPEVAPYERYGDAKPCHGCNIWGQGVASHRLFLNNKETYHKFRSILPDVLRMHDYVGKALADLYNNGYRGKVKAGSLKLCFTDRTPYKYNNTTTPFTGELPIGPGEPRFPVKPLWYAIVGSFRSMVVERGDQFTWIMPFEDVLEKFDSVAHRMVAKARALGELKDLDYVARHTNNLWEDMYNLMRERS